MIPDLNFTNKDIKEKTHKPALITILKFNVDTELQT